MSNPKGINQYTGKGGSAKAAKPKKSPEVLPPGHVRKGSSIIRPNGTAIYSPRSKPRDQPVTSQKRLKAIFNNKYN